jgi:Zn ribbon nucleic-acid-binding protein
MLIVAVLFATVLLRFGIVLGGVYLMLPATRICPHCASDLTLIRHPVLRRLIPRIEHRWCVNCGWNSLVRRPPAPRNSAQSRVISRAARS